MSYLTKRSTRRTGLRSQIKKTLEDLNTSKKEEERMILRRSGLRVHFRKTLDNANGYLREENLDKAKLLGFKKSLMHLSEQLEAIDNEVQKFLDGDKIEEDVIESLELLEPVNDIISSLEVKMSELDISVASPPSISPQTSTSSISNMCRLPKMDLPVFKGDPLKWQGFWDQFQVSIHDNERISDIDRFNFLKKYLGGEALNAVAGLNLSAENYKEAVALLKDRYGNEQILISAHMESLLKIPKVTRKEDIKGLRDLYNHVESCVRNLRSLKLETNGYGSLLIPIMKQKLPDDLTILIARKFGAAVWSFEKVLEFFNEELRAQENCASALVNHSHGRYPEKNPKPNGYTARFDIQNESYQCVYCKETDHFSSKCKNVTNFASRKKILRNEKRCFVCLKDGHSFRRCPSKYVCKKCGEKGHHISLCVDKSVDQSLTAFSAENRKSKSELTGVLMQTAKAHVFDTSASKNTCLTRILFDTGSQRTYVSENLRKKLKLPTVRKQKVIIKTFGNESNNQVRELDVVQLKVKHKNDNSFTFIEAFCTPLICSPLKGQCINRAKAIPEFTDIEFADANDEDDLSIGILVGLDKYYKFFQGENLHSSDGVTASKTVLGWVLSGEISDGSNSNRDNAMLITSIMRCSVEKSTPLKEEDALRQDLNKFWNVEDVASPDCVISKFEKDIFHDGERYVTKLPFKMDHDRLPDNFNVAKQRLLSLKPRLHKLGIFERYDTVFKEYEENGIIEQVPQDSISTESGQVHYMPHRPVVREDKETTKIRAVFDASCKVNGPSLNECLYPGPNLLLKIFDVLLRFRFNRIAILADIKQAFLNVGISNEHIDFLRFLWFDNGVNVVVYRFKRAVFGVTSSPFLLNATIKHHLRKFCGSDLQDTVEKIEDDLYVDDLISGCDSVEEGKVYFQQAKDLMKSGGFLLRKWTSNDPELSSFLSSCESDSEPQTSSTDEVKFFEAMSNQMDKDSTVLGVKWDRGTDEFVFDFKSLLNKCHTMTNTKRELLSVAASLFDPLGMVSPVTTRIKMIFQLLCKDKLSWDDKIPQNILDVWNTFIFELTAMKKIKVPRFVLSPSTSDIIELHGFSDSSKEAYCAVIYIRCMSENVVCTRFLTSKTRVAPLKELSIPRLELLGCLLLSKLMKEVLKGLENKVNIGRVICWSDSKVSLAWINGKEKSWKPWVENRVVEIRQVVGRENWRYVRGELNPADIPTRSSKSLNESFCESWFSGPSFLYDASNVDFLEGKVDSPLTKDVLKESKKSFLGGEGILTDDNDKMTTLTTTTTNDSVSNGLSDMIKIERFSSLRKLVNVVAYVKRYITKLQNKIKTTTAVEGKIQDDEITLDEFDNSLHTVIKLHQIDVKKSSNFQKLKSSLKLFEDENGFLRLRGRFMNSNFTHDEQFPLFLDSKSWLVNLIIWNAHEAVLHNGLESTLAYVRRKYWITSGRRTVKNIIRKCVTCKRFQGKTLLPPESPDLPDFRLNYITPFSATGLDFAGPLLVRDNKAYQKVYILLLTCATSRAIHLELVPDLTDTSFIRAFQRFIARRGTPSLVVNDNAKTFRSRQTKSFMKKLNIRQQFILPASPWWGGFYERLVRSVKSSIKKTLGKSLITADELHTLLCQIESVINSRPLFYSSEDDLQNVLTPNHLIFGRDITNNFTRFSDNTISSIEFGRKVVHLQQIIKHYQKRFKNTYLNELRQSNLYRKSKSTSSPHLAVNDVVLIKDDNPLPRQEWRMGRVVNLIHGKDGKLRGAKLSLVTENGRKTTAHRPLQKLIPFEIEHTDNEPEPKVDPEPETKNESNATSDDRQQDLVPNEAHDKGHANYKRFTRKAAIQGQLERRLREKYF